MISALSPYICTDLSQSTLLFVGFGQHLAMVSAYKKTRGKDEANEERNGSYILLILFASIICTRE